MIDITGFEKMRDEYYELRGWNPATGLQRGGALRALGLHDVADDLAARDLLA